jgi:hypothetical protein
VTWQAHGSAIPAHSRAVGSNQTWPARHWRWARRPDCHSGEQSVATGVPISRARHGCDRGGV